MKKHWIKKAMFIPVIIAAGLVVFSTAVMLLWNSILPGLFMWLNNFLADMHMGVSIPSPVPKILAEDIRDDTAHDAAARKLFHSHELTRVDRIPKEHNCVLNTIVLLL